MKLEYKVDGKIQDVGVHHGGVQVAEHLEMNNYQFGRNCSR